MRTPHTRYSIWDFIIAFAASIMVTAVCYPIRDAIGYQSVGLIFLMTISVLSLFLGRAALIFTAILNFGVWNFFFIQPLYTFRVHSLHDLIALFTNLIVAIAASALINRIRKSKITLQQSQEQLQRIHCFLESLNDSVSIKDVVKHAEEGIQNNFSSTVLIYLKEKNGNGLSRRPFGNTRLHGDQAFNAAISVFSDPTRTNTVTTEDIIFYPLAEARKLIGVIGIQFPDKKFPRDEQLILLPSLLTLLASALDREMNIDQAKEKEISSESEKLFRTVLNSVSHELKTPISIISAAVANLNDMKTSSEPELRKQIGEELEIASLRLNHLVENILDMSRIESGILRLNLQVCDIADLIGIVNNDLKILDHSLKIEIEENIPFIRADINLLKQVLFNVLHNAVSYSPKQTLITIEVKRSGQEGLSISVKDEGPGIPEQFRHQLFEKFFRVPGTRTGGTGLGLTISKAITELHGGTITINNRPSGGLEVIIHLKIDHGTYQ